MATLSSSIPDIIGRLPQLETRTVLGAVRGVKDQARLEARRVVGSDNRMSNVGKKGAKLGARDDYKRGAKVATVRAVPPGPWAWINTGTSPHLIGVGRANRRTGNYAASRFRKGPKRLGIGEGKEGTRMGPVFHPGMAGRGAWRRVKREAPNIIRRAGRVELGRLIRGR